jgi:glycosyltransferase involved in cell wall biosynthesis
LWEQIFLPSAVHGRLLWSPNNTGPIAVARQICTIHDLIPLDHPEWFSTRFSGWYSWLLPRLARRVEHIITISEYTKYRIVERLRVAPEKITVIPNGVDRRFSPRSAEEIQAVRDALGITAPSYLLCVGSLEPRKNLVRLLMAWRRIQSRVAGETELVVAGAAGDSRVFRVLSTEADRTGTHFTGYVPEEYLPALYSGALALVYPSLYEGFGLPPLEALACGTPVITSDRTSLPEVVGDSAVFVNPENTDSIAEGMWRIFSSQRLRAILREKGMKRSQGFTWERSASETLRLLLEHSGSGVARRSAA